MNPLHMLLMNFYTHYPFLVGFETITMDFITELPVSGGFDAILVMVNKLTKYGHFITVLEFMVVLC